MSKSQEDLPGLQEIPTDLHIADQSRFIDQIPNLLTRLRLRKPTAAFSLNLTPSSLTELDDLVADVIGEILSRDLDVAGTIERDFVTEVVAYVGEVLIRSKNGNWQTTDSEAHFGPLVVFPVQGDEKLRHRAVDVYSKVLTTLLEGEPIRDWYEEEIE